MVNGLKEVVERFKAPLPNGLTASVKPFIHTISIRDFKFSL